LKGPTIETLDAVGASAHGNRNVTGTTVAVIFASTPPRTVMQPKNRLFPDYDTLG